MCLEHRRTEGGVFDVFADIIECLKRVVVHVVHVVHWYTWYTWCSCSFKPVLPRPERARPSVSLWSPGEFFHIQQIKIFCLTLTQAVG